MSRSVCVGRRPGFGEAGEGVLGDDLGHGDGAFGQGGEAGGVHGGGGDDGGALADEHAQAQVAALGAFEVLGFSLAGGDGERGAGDQHGVRGVGSGGTRLDDQVGQG